MSARINHVAITSDYYAMNARFYEALFGMKTGKKTLPPARAISLGDGYVGMTHIPRRDGRTAGLDHFGIEVDDIEDTIVRMQKFDPELSALKRPPIRPYAAFSAHDPDTNIFDLSQRNIGFQKDVYADNKGDEVQPRAISHIALRTRNAEHCAHFYAEVFGLPLLNRPSDENYYLSDGRVTLSTGTLYGALRRLLDEEWIERFKEQDSSRGRQAYRLTARGRRNLQFEVGRMKHLTRLANLRIAAKEA